jgi:hypothetical protein
MRVVYALIDPVTQMIRYIGQSVCVEKRFSNYRRIAKSSWATTTNDHLDRWLRKLHNAGTPHETEILESGFESQDDLNEAEAFWENYWRAMGSPLINIRKCGGARGAHSPSTRRKMSEAAKGRVHGPETRRRMSESHKKKRLTEEHKRKIGEASRGHACSPEQREKIAASKRGRRLSPEHKAAIVAGHARRKLGS